MFDTIVIGGGIIGAACAAELKKRGQNVLVLDSSQPGTGVTAACMGHVVVMDDSPSMLEFTRYSRDLWTELSNELPENCEDFMPGTLWVAEDDDEMLEAVRKKQIFEQAGIKCEIVDREDILNLEPNLKKGLAGGLRICEDRVVYPTNCVRYLLRDIEVRANCKVTGIEKNIVKLADGNSLSAENIVVASGLGTTALLDLPVVPKKGHLAITQRYPGFVNHQIIELGYIKKAHGAASASTAFNIQPRKNGQMILGSSREYSGDDKSINQNILEEMLKKSVYFLPGLSKLKCLRVWTGMRPSTPDGVPYIGRFKEENLFVCAGHEGLGITTSLASAKIIAAQIHGEKPEIDDTLYSPNRVLTGELAHEH